MPTALSIVMCFPESCLKVTTTEADTLLGNTEAVSESRSETRASG